MAKGPGEVIKHVHSAWNKKINDVEAKIDEEIGKGSTLPLRIAIPWDLDAAQKQELLIRYTKVGWKASTYVNEVDDRDPREVSTQYIVLDV